MVTSITLDSIKSLQNNILHIIMFYGEACGPCKSTMPHYETLALEKTTDTVRFHKFHQWENDDYKFHGETVWGVTGVPTFKAVFNGKTLVTKVGGGDEQEMRRFYDSALEEVNSVADSTKMRVKKVSLDATIPTKAHVGDLGYDLYSAVSQTIYPGETGLVSTGIAIQFPTGYGGLIRDRSSVATKNKVFNVAGVIDNGYVGEIKVALFNSTEDIFHIRQGDKIAQMILIPVTNVDILEVQELVSADQRGVNGFGSTGR